MKKNMNTETNRKGHEDKLVLDQTGILGENKHQPCQSKFECKILPDLFGADKPPFPLFRKDLQLIPNTIFSVNTASLLYRF